jgi:hypothetical protein
MSSIAVAGLLLRRTVPAMVATLVVFVGIRLAFTNWGSGPRSCAEGASLASKARMRV